MNPVSAVPVVRRAYRSCAAEAVRSGQVRSERQPQSAAKGRRMPKSRKRYSGPEGRFPHYTAVSVGRRAYRSCAAGAVRSCPVRKATAVCRKGPADAEVADTLSGAGGEVSALHGRVGEDGGEAPFEAPDLPAPKGLSASKCLLLRKACRRGNPRRNGDPRRRAGPVRGRDRLFRNSLPAVCPYEWRRYNPRR